VALGELLKAGRRLGRSGRHEPCFSNPSRR
jgi:hypothetical protein